MYDEVSQVIDGKISVGEAASRLQVSRRTVYRKINAYLYEGIEGFSHKSKGRAPNNELSLDTWNRIVWLYQTKYEGYNFSHYLDMLREREGVDVGYATLYSILTDAGFVSPRARKKRKRKLHPTRERRPLFGELVQMDASIHLWFGDKKATLHLAIDDATSRVLGAYFDWHETLHGYYQVFYQILVRYGVPKAYYTDKRSIFEYRKSASTSLADDAHTQFRLAAAQTGVAQILTTSVPQAKGRVERAFGTFQDRLVSEMRTAGITTIREANIFLGEFVYRHNAKFALDHRELDSAFGPIPSDEEINISLALVSERKVLSGCIVSYNNQKYLPVCDKGQVYLPLGSEVLIIKAFDDRLFLSFDKHLWPLVSAEKPVKVEQLDLPEGRLYEEKRYRYLIKRFREAA